ncbi:hypothetical protein [Haladaptatus sp. CMSO5]|uniref:hypothetical protein n=1 Tax=Haladaptatus sp. CMSO5 TaxID=3120514 RepID=UPI002FCE5A84
MVAGVAFVFVFLILALAGPLLLYFIIQSETDDNPVMGRDEAEQAAREGYEKSK